MIKGNSKYAGIKCRSNTESVYDANLIKVEVEFNEPPESDMGTPSGSLEADSGAQNEGGGSTSLSVKPAKKIRQVTQLPN